MRPGRNGGTLRTGNPGNRGNPNGRRGLLPLRIRAGRALGRLLADLEGRLIEGPPLSTRDVIAYGKLCAEIETRQLPGDKPPKRIMVLSGSAGPARRARSSDSVAARRRGRCARAAGAE